jgi:hypothetical protein
MQIRTLNESEYAKVCPLKSPLAVEEFIRNGCGGGFGLAALHFG